MSGVVCGAVDGLGQARRRTALKGCRGIVSVTGSTSIATSSTSTITVTTSTIIAASSTAAITAASASTTSTMSPRPLAAETVSQLRPNGEVAARRHLGTGQVTKPPFLVGPL
ncbi:hypothetical protein E2C01_063203 [Portunus trituberculatus]|uniref:Uncharacterized protein n=1 Tax=Portunus trituberculatus TaxID=210409 RepID=A0A5B7HGV1_PORTR|nr:hypothetical protein [Portunus trituberculatus]